MKKFALLALCVLLVMASVSQAGCKHRRAGRRNAAVPVECIQPDSTPAPSTPLSLDASRGASVSVQAPFVSVDVQTDTQAGGRRHGWLWHRRHPNGQ